MDLLTTRLCIPIPTILIDITWDKPYIYMRQKGKDKILPSG